VKGTANSTAASVATDGRTTGQSAALMKAMVSPAMGRRLTLSGKGRDPRPVRSSNHWPKTKA
jgi:hypothetical protein